jgi:two-component system cell cycle sensor histidine kinase PleC
LFKAVMGDITAEMIERGRKGDPAEAARRRKMTIKLKHARQSLTAKGDDNSGPYDSMVRLFAQSAKSATPAQVALTLAIGAGAAFFSPVMPVLAWGLMMLPTIGARFALGSAFLKLRDPEKSARIWRVFFTMLEAGFGGAWALIVVQLLQSPEPNAHSFALIVVMLVAGMIAMMGSAIPAAVGAGLMPMMVAIVALFSAGSRRDLLILSLLCGGVLAYFIALANRLHRTALAGLSYQAEKDALIAELEQAKLNSDEARRRAEGANLAKSRFLATMSHELRTPLNAILGFSEVMKAELFGALNVPTYKEYAGDIHSSGQHLLMLINEILDLSRVEAGRYELKEESVSLPGVVDECRHLLALRAKNKSIAIIEVIEDKLPRIWADERAIRQVMLNLLSNAIKFTPQGGEVTIKVGWTTAGGQYLSVRDNGPGIPEDEIPIVLSSFGRGAMAQKNAEEGSGLGLPIVRGLVELHGGEFKLQSKVREGTEVIVIIPPERVMNALPQLDPDALPELPEAAREQRRRLWQRRRQAA